MTKWTSEQNREFWEAFLRYRGEQNIADSYRLAARVLSAAGKPTPSLMTFRNWYRKAMRGELAKEAGEGQTGRTGRTGRTEGAEEEAAQTEEAGAAEEAAADNYTVRLEKMLRLYRRRSEADCDAVCDELVPELLQGEPT